MQKINKNISCVILAGGKSSRMGKDKALLPFRGFETMAEYQFDKFKDYFQNIYISTKDKDKFNFQSEFIEDFIKPRKSSPLVGFLSIFQQIESEYIFVLSVDTPNFGIDEFHKLYEMIDEESEAIVPSCDNYTHNTCAIYKNTIVPIIQNMVSHNNHKLKFLLNAIETKFVKFEDKTKFLNLNYLEDYQKAELGDCCP